MNSYETIALAELRQWQRRMAKKPSFTSRMAIKLQARVNRMIPERVHRVITTAIKHMTQAVCFGAEFTTRAPLLDTSLEQREQQVRERIRFYRNTAAAEGAVTGAGGILLGLADFPIWLGLKMKMLFEIAALYGVNTSDYTERVYLLYIFELTFSSQANRNRVYEVMNDWEQTRGQLPHDLNDFNWRRFQQEYRDFIDIAKLLQLIPGIGAPVGALVNHRLTTKLGNMAMNAYRMRWASLKKMTGHSNEYPAIQ